MRILLMIAGLFALATQSALAEWRTVALVDEFGDPLGQNRVYAESTFADGEHWCRLYIDPIRPDKSWRNDFFPARGRIGLACDYFNLTGKDRNGMYNARAKIDDQTPITVSLWPHASGLGGSLVTFKLDGEEYDTKGGILPTQPYYRSFSDKVFNSIHGSGLLRVSLPYYSMGKVLLTFPLEGLADALENAGFDTRQYTEYESTHYNDDGSILDKNIFWLHESDYDEYLKVRSDSKYRITYRAR